MIDKNFLRHAREFIRHIRNFKYEMSPEGILFPQAAAVAGGEYFYDSNGERPGRAENLLPVESFNYLLEAGLRGGSSTSAFYLALFGNATTPDENSKASTFATDYGEFTSGSSGYSENTRRPWLAEPASGGKMDNLDNRASFSIVAQGQLTIRGAALLSDPTKGGGDGVLISVARFPNSEVQSNGSVFNLGYRVRLRQPNL